MSLLVFTAFPLWAVSELVNENFQGGCNFQGIPAYSFACSLDTLHCEFASPLPHCLRLQLLASIAQLAEHALRKRTVVGSIPTGGFLFGSSARQKVSMRNAQHGAATHWRM